MKPDTPILMITLQIPVLPETSADEVLDAIGQQVSQALHAIRAQQADKETPDEDVASVAVESAPLTPEQLEFKQSVIKETLEEPSAEFARNVLAEMGYPIDDQS